MIGYGTCLLIQLFVFISITKKIINMQPEQNPANDLLAFEPELERATTGQRFANYFIDLILFYLLFIIFGIVIAILSPSTLENINTDDSGFALLDRLLSLIFYALYMGVVESIFKGKSLGKLITSTRAVNMDGSKISVYRAFTRGFSRAVPFCVFSALGTPCNPWQDRWTDTMVIDEKKSRAV
jgi:uncharacterized RDD family membrane protein YckC